MRIRYCKYVTLRPDLLGGFRDYLEIFALEFCVLVLAGFRRRRLFDRSLITAYIDNDSVVGALLYAVSSSAQIPKDIPRFSYMVSHRQIDLRMALAPWSLNIADPQPVRAKPLFTRTAEPLATIYQLIPNTDVAQYLLIRLSKTIKQLIRLTKCFTALPSTWYGLLYRTRTLLLLLTLRTITTLYSPTPLKDIRRPPNLDTSA